MSILGSKYKTVRSLTRSLAASLSAEDQMAQSCPEASPVKWHQAHTTWFFETFVLRPFLADYRPFREDFHRLFNSYHLSLDGEQFPRRGCMPPFLGRRSMRFWPFVRTLTGKWQDSWSDPWMRRRHVALCWA